MLIQREKARVLYHYIYCYKLNTGMMKNSPLLINEL